MTSFAHQAAQIDTAALARYLEARLPGFRGPITAEKTPSGQSNPTFILGSPSGKYVLRKKPPGQLLKSAHAVDREYRVMKGLENTDVPVPRMLLLCEDDSVIGTAFFVMEFVDGTVFWNPALPELTKAQRANVYDQYLMPALLDLLRHERVFHTLCVHRAQNGNRRHGQPRPRNNRLIDRPDGSSPNSVGVASL